MTPLKQPRFSRLWDLDIPEFSLRDWKRYHDGTVHLITATIAFLGLSHNSIMRGFTNVHIANSGVMRAPCPGPPQFIYKPYKICPQAATVIPPYPLMSVRLRQEPLFSVEGLVKLGM